MNYEQKVKAERLLVELRDRAYSGDKEALQELFDFAHNMLTNEYVRLKESTEGDRKKKVTEIFHWKVIMAAADVLSECDDWGDMLDEFELTHKDYGIKSDWLTVGHILEDNKAKITLIAVSMRT